MVGVGVAFLIALSWSLLAIPLGAHFGIVDRPDDSSLNVHDHPAVPLGGIGVFAAVTVGMGITGNSAFGAMVAAGRMASGTIAVAGATAWCRATPASAVCPTSTSRIPSAASAALSVLILASRVTA